MVGKKLAQPFNRAKNGMSYYLQILFNYLKICFTAIYDTIAVGVKAVGSALYKLTKSLLLTLWASAKFLFDLIIIKLLGSLYHLYFGIFRFILNLVKPLGVFGELLFIIFGLFWLLWPLYGSYWIQVQYGHPEAWIGGVIVSIALIVRGRQIMIDN